MLKRARDQGLTVGELIVRMVEGPNNTPPLKVPAPDVQPTPLQNRDCILAEVEAVMQMAQEISAATGVPVPEIIAERAFAVLADRLERMRDPKV